MFKIQTAWNELNPNTRRSENANKRSYRSCAHGVFGAGNRPINCGWQLVCDDLGQRGWVHAHRWGWLHGYPGNGAARSRSVSLDLFRPRNTGRHRHVYRWRSVPGFRQRSVSIGTTSVPVNDGTACGNDPLGCTGNDWSHGTFVLGSGNHSITMTLVAAATGYISGGAAFELTTAAPTPTPGPPTFGLVILGCVGLALGRWLFRLQRETVRLS